MLVFLIMSLREAARFHHGVIGEWRIRIGEMRRSWVLVATARRKGIA
ncbi:MAG: hypothetical protein R3338_05320 [Thermoanaerobaculia bacterium]|nr:hypothetical protein [Thermoanaerobaculia bacterium]